MTYLHGLRFADRRKNTKFKPSVMVLKCFMVTGLLPALFKLFKIITSQFINAIPQKHLFTRSASRRPLKNY